MRSRWARSVVADAFVMPSVYCCSDEIHFVSVCMHLSLSCVTSSSTDVRLSAPLFGWSSCFVSRSYSAFASVTMQGLCGS